eukprot:2855850-Pyramimonas_sp.AAC.3
MLTVASLFSYPSTNLSRGILRARVESLPLHLDMLLGKARCLPLFVALVVNLLSEAGEKLQRNSHIVQA